MSNILKMVLIISYDDMNSEVNIKYVIVIINLCLHYVFLSLKSILQTLLT